MSVAPEFAEIPVGFDTKGRHYGPQRHGGKEGGDKGHQDQNGELALGQEGLGNGFGFHEAVAQ